MERMSTQKVENVRQSSPDSDGFSQSATLNPYRFAAFELLNRLRWDFNPESWRSRAKLRAWKNKYADKKAVILCNGPSLLKSDLSMLDGYFTFGLNKINLLFDKTTFRPSCIVSVNPFVIEQNADFFNQTDIPLFLDRVALKDVRARDNVTMLHSAGQSKFARDCSISIYQGSTVTFVAMQLAFHIGFRQVALIGCDHNFTTTGPANQTVIAGKRDDNHFDPNYFAGGVKWQLPDLPNSEAAYSLALVVYETAGRKLVNCTEGGRLELLPRISLDNFVRS
ncbi:6-hydroxymethylpterin diphosphokinase MptE-like protein [Gloeobacter violaceus]|uniref:Glr3783 protein n=1 Tax=Gloeobacter violaceus (strain ATCC 29082 / PCC 7421) TaxID=251221 RepID=Q7NEU5_GLOVI|nr:6-hydroxymethylpterin diphosphokinase MptE-like protein [Gloeobacter violaceus]BAC91724.1 glr3783 [Gloeobacter violaceus PCC 7421]